MLTRMPHKHHAALQPAGLERAGLPSFATRNALASDKGWSAYFSGLYGGLPPEAAFPIDTAALWLLHTDIKGAVNPAARLQIHDCPTQPGDAFQRMSIDHDLANTVSLLRLGPFTAMPDHALVEVTHCRDKEAVENEAGANWMYRADGSGIFFNVGKTIAFQRHRDLVHRFLRGQRCPDDECLGNGGLSEGFAVAAREGYDSVQFLAHPDQRCSGHADTAARGVPTAHEIVDVRPGASGQYACGVKDAKKTRYTSGWGGTQPCSCSNDFACSNCRRIRKRAYGELDPDELERALRWLETAVEDMELQLRGRRRVVVRDTLVVRLESTSVV